MIKQLQKFKGFTVDMRLQEFRKIEMDKLPQFIPFTSDRGARLCHDFILTARGRKILNEDLGRQN